MWMTLMRAIVNMGYQGKSGAVKIHEMILIFSNIIMTKL